MDNDPAAVRDAIDEGLAMGKVKLVEGRLALGFLDAAMGLP